MKFVDATEHGLEHMRAVHCVIYGLVSGKELLQANERCVRDDRRPPIDDVRKIERRAVKEVEVNTVGGAHIGSTVENAKASRERRQEDDVVVGTERTVRRVYRPQAVLYFQVWIEVRQIGSVPDLEWRACNPIGVVAPNLFGARVENEKWKPRSFRFEVVEQSRQEPRAIVRWDDHRVRGIAGRSDPVKHTADSLA